MTTISTVDLPAGAYVSLETEAEAAVRAAELNVRAAETHLEGARLALSEAQAHYATFSKG